MQITDARLTWWRSLWTKLLETQKKGEKDYRHTHTQKQKNSQTQIQPISSDGNVSPILHNGSNAKRMNLDPGDGTNTAVTCADHCKEQGGSGQANAIISTNADTDAGNDGGKSVGVGAGFMGSMGLPDYESDSDEEIHSPKSPKEDESQEKEETGGSRRSVRISTLFSCENGSEAGTDTDTTVGVTNQTNQGILGKRSERSGSGSIACPSTELDTMSIQIDNAFVTAATSGSARLLQSPQYSEQVQYTLEYLQEHVNDLLKKNELLRMVETCHRQVYLRVPNSIPVGCMTDPLRYRLGLPHRVRGSSSTSNLHPLRCVSHI